MDSAGVSEFLAVARAGSFTKAAQALDVSVPHVSRQVRRLEAKLGIVLFHRTTRAVTLTSVGQRLFRDCESIATHLDQAFNTARAADTSLSGRIRIASMSGSFADEVVVPALATFAKAHPEVSLDVDFSPRKVDLIHDGYDLAIRSGVEEPNGLIIRRLAERLRIAAASPEYLRNFGTPQVPSDLRHHDCIRTVSNAWSFEEKGRRREISVTGRLRFNAGSAVRTACEAGLGIAYMAEEGFADSIECGRLVPILKPYWRNSMTIHAVYPSADFVPERLEQLVSHLERSVSTRGASSFNASQISDITRPMV